MTKVAAVKADSYDPHIVQQAIADLLAHLGGMSQFIQPGDRVLVKPNMLEEVSILLPLPHLQVFTHSLVFLCWGRKYHGGVLDKA